MKLENDINKQLMIENNELRNDNKRLQKENSYLKLRLKDIKNLHLKNNYIK